MIRKEAIRAVNRAEETKSLDGVINTNSISYAGTLYSLHGSYSTGSFVPITQGVDNQQYQGRVITPRYLNMRYQVTSADSTNTFSIIVVQTKGLWNNNGDMANIYQTTSSVVAPLSAIDTSYDHRFRVLYRRQIVVDTDDSVKTGIIKLNWKKLRRIAFSDTAGSCESGHLMLGVISDSSAVTHPTFNCYWRLYYKDA